MSGPVVGLSVPNPDFPVLGLYIPVAFLFIVHIAIAEYSLGAITLGVSFEWWALRTGEPRWLRLSRALANSYYLLFSLGATLGVFAVTAVIGLWGKQLGTLVNLFLPLVAVAFGLFLAITPMLVVYRNRAATMRAAPHLALGVALCALQTAFMVLIVGIDAYLITPQQTGLGGAFLNPAYWPLLGHRLIGNVSWTALLVAAVAVVRLRGAAGEEDRAYHAAAASVLLRIGTAALLLMIPVGGAIVAVLSQSQPGFFDNLFRGDAAYLFVVQAALLGILVVGVNVALAHEMPGERDGLDLMGRAAIGVAAAGMVVGLLPSQVLPESVYALRYAGIGVAVVATLVHLVRRSVGGAAPRLALAPGAQAVMPFTSSARGRRAVVLVGAAAAALALYMGYLKSEARGQYAIYGEMTQQDAHGTYSPPGVYP